MTVIDELQEPSFAHQCVRQVQSIEFDLLRVVDAKGFAKPVIQRAAVLEFQRADTVGDALNGIRLSVGPVVRWVNAPRITGAMMFHLSNSIHNGVAKQHHLVPHVNFGSKNVVAFFKLAVSHAAKQIKILIDRTISVRTVSPGFGRSSATCANFFEIKAADVGLSSFNQLLSPLEKLLEVIRCEEQSIFPVESEPFDVVLNGFNIFHLFLFRVGVVEAEIALATVFLSDAKIEAD